MISNLLCTYELEEETNFSLIYLVNEAAELLMTRGSETGGQMCI